ncbi:MAG TPA: TolC family protein [Tepidisphaeraceae bacterium]|jgi:cobalt-zinc-cadmium efflux system outer membrane protein
MPSKLLPALLLATLAFTGCTPAPPQAHFATVQQTVAQRTGATIHWRTGSPEDATADHAVHALLNQPLTAEAVAQIALLNNRHLQAMFEEIGIAQADLVQAGLLKNPVFDLGVRFPNRSPSKTYLDLSIASDFIELFLIPARQKLAGATLRQADLRVADQVLETVARAKSDFYRYQAAGQMLELRRQVASATSASADAAGRLFEAGNIAELDRLAEQTQDARAQIELASAQAESAETRETVNKVMGLTAMIDSWKPIPRLLDPPPADVDSSELESVAIRQRQDLAAAREDFALQSQSLTFTRQTRFLSAATLGAEAERETDGQWRIGPALSVPIPLFDQGQGAIARQQAILRQSRARYDALSADVRSEVRSGTLRLQNARAKAALYRDQVLPLQHRLVEQTQLHFNGMFVGVFQLLEARRAEISAGSEYIAALRDYWTARAELERATGGGALPQGSPAATQSATTHPSTPDSQPMPADPHEHHHHGANP